VIDLLQHLVHGVSLGAIYALIALGYTMVYGVLQLINFAHGDVFMLGAMMGWYASSRWTQEAAHPSWAGAVAVTLLSMAICGTAGFLIERFGYRPLRGSPLSSPPSACRPSSRGPCTCGAVHSISTIPTSCLPTS